MKCPYCTHPMVLEDTFEDDLKTRTAFYYCINPKCEMYEEPVDVPAIGYATA